MEHDPKRIGCRDPESSSPSCARSRPTTHPTRHAGREPRYLFPPGFRKSQVVFNLHRAVEFAARQGGVAIVVEGFFDCLKVHQAGYGNVVALMGASLSDRQSELLHTYFRELVVMLDGDETGRRASRALVARWPAASMAWVPAGWQPDQLSSEEIERILNRGSRAPGAQ